MPLIRHESSRRGALALLAILVFLLSGCTRVSETSAPSDSMAPSEPAASVSEPEEPETPPSPMADGKLALSMTITGTPRPFSMVIRLYTAAKASPTS